MKFVFWAMVAFFCVAFVAIKFDLKRAAEKISHCEELGGIILMDKCMRKDLFIDLKEK